MGPNEFNIQQALTDMEDRIRTDIQEVGSQARTDSAAARAVADSAILAASRVGADAAVANAKLDGRVLSLEEKAAWIGAGFGATFLALAGLGWRTLFGKL